MRAACIIAAIGATGSGKTTFVRSLPVVAKADRLAVWDYKKEWGRSFGLERVTTREEFLRAIARPKFRVAYEPPVGRGRDAAFDLWCRACYAVGNLTMLVEELALVTEPGRAPDAWMNACLTGRDYIDARGKRKHLSIIGTAQRPALVDKSFFGNATLIHCGRLSYDRDVKVMAEELGVRPDEIRALGDLEFIQRDRLANAVRRGKLTIAGPVKSARSRRKA